MLLKEFSEKKKMKKLILFVLLTSLSLAQAPNLFYTYLTTAVNSTDTTFYFTATDTTFAGSGTSYYAIIWDTYYANPVDAYKAGKAEMVIINSRSGRTFDVTRGALSTTARSFNTSGRRYKISVDLVAENLLSAFSIADDGKVLTNNGSQTSWTSKYTDSNAVYRTAINKQLDTNVVLRTALNVRQDSIAVHRTAINKQLDTNAVIRTALNNHTDSIAVHRTALSGKQPLNSDLTSISGLSPTNDDIVQRKSGAWTNRTVAQVKNDFAIPQMLVFNVNNGGNLTSGTTSIYTPYSATAIVTGVARYYFRSAGVLKNLYVWGGISTSLNVTFTVYRGYGSGSSASTSLLKLLNPSSSGVRTASNLSDTLNINADTWIELNVANSASGFAGTNLGASVEFYPTY